MPSNKFQTLAHKIARRDKAVFDALLEFEETKKMQSKTRLNFTIDKAVAQHFKKFCKNHGYSMSAKVEQAMQKLIEERTV